MSANLNSLDRTGGAEDFGEPTGTPSGAVTTKSAAANPAVPTFALLGARADLKLARSAAKTATCQCLAVVAGSASDEAFQWEERYPVVDPTRQYVLALSSASLPCPAAPEGNLGASYWGYELSGGDVIVVVENAVEGRPVMSGALIPMPQEGGRILVRPLDKTVPFGAGLDGSRVCAIEPRKARVIPLPSEPEQPPVPGPAAPPPAAPAAPPAEPAPEAVPPPPPVVLD